MNRRRFSIPAAIVFAWAALLVILPLLYVFALSFMTRSENGGVLVKFTLSNYTRIFDATYLRIFGISGLIAVVTTALTILFGYPMGYFMATAREKYRSYLMLLIMVPFWTNSLLRVNGWLILLRRDGLINSLLGALNVIDEPLGLMNSYGAVLMVTVYMLLPFMILPVYNSALRLDKSLKEASRDLGASKLRTFLKVTLPLTVPGIAAGATLVFIPAVGLFFISDLVGSGKTMLIGNLIQNQFQSTRNWPFGAALSVIMIIGVSISVILLRKANKSGEGGVFL